jgi:hypothetical protein
VENRFASGKADKNPVEGPCRIVSGFTNIRTDHARLLRGWVVRHFILPMCKRMASGAQRDQIQIVIISTLTTELLVVNL